jgi:ribose 5-phosphate isomerase B
MSIVANRHPGIRAALVTTSYMAEMAKKHNNANVLCFGGRVVKADEARAMVKIWLESAYEGGRHENRLKKI